MSETIEKPFLEPIGTDAQASETFFNRLVGINEAATISRASKGQISRDTNAKKLPFVLNDKEQKRYRVADLYQQYGFRPQEGTGIMEPVKPAEKEPETLQNAIELAVLKERVSRLESENSDLRHTRDQLLDQNARFTLLLAAPPAVTPEPTSSPAPAERKPFWKRFFS